MDTITDLVGNIEKYGLSETIKTLTELTNQRIGTKLFALLFVLEELEAASQGSETSRAFAKNSGFSEDEYKNAMLNSLEEVSGANSPQEFLTILLELNDRELMALIRITIVDNIMQIWKLGKYKEQSDPLREKIEKLEKLRQVMEVQKLIKQELKNLNDELREI
jgi:hypothetical protein